MHVFFTRRLLRIGYTCLYKGRAFNGPGLDDNMLRDSYSGPRKFLSLVYCLAYGENEALTGQANGEHRLMNREKGLCIKSPALLTLSLSKKTKQIRAQANFGQCSQLVPEE